MAANLKSVKGMEAVVQPKFDNELRGSRVVGPFDPPPLLNLRIWALYQRKTPVVSMGPQPLGTADQLAGGNFTLKMTHIQLIYCSNVSAIEVLLKYLNKNLN